ncbi:uncharacterized protein [Aristolochia californica]|uniref:uncharacterized protein n=1 Tax=Aristolochia californica TaxID=171875 RepID=UPI0035E0AD2E
MSSSVPCRLPTMQQQNPGLPPPARTVSVSSMEDPSPRSYASDSASSAGVRVISLRHLKKHLGDAGMSGRVGSSDGFSDGYSSNSGKEAGPGLKKAHSGVSDATRLRSFDVYIGLHGRKLSLLRFGNWVRAELELQGVSCYMADRSRFHCSRSLAVAEQAMDEATMGVVILTKKSFSDGFCIHEIRRFLGRKNLIPIFFSLNAGDCSVMNIIEKRTEAWVKHGGEVWKSYGGEEKEWREAVHGLSQIDEWKLEAHPNNWRDCVLETVVLLGKKLGKLHVIEKVNQWKEVLQKEEFPLSRNSNFLGRRHELLELELLLFGGVDGKAKLDCFEIKSDQSIRNKLEAGEESAKAKKGKDPLKWRESDRDIEMEGFKNPDSKPIGSKGRRLKAWKSMYGKGVAVVSGESGMGKTELLLEFAYRVRQRYQMVLWIGGEARYICQNYLNFMSFLGVDMSVENLLSNERSRPRSFEEMEMEAIFKMRKELMRDIPFLVVIDNLEVQKDWWDGRDVMDLLPRFGGATHVIISTRLPRVLDLEPLRLSSFLGSEAMSLMNKRQRDLSTEDNEALRVIEESLQGLTLGLAIVGYILNELPISPTALLNTINRMPLREFTWSSNDGTILRDNPFLMRLLEVCFSIFRFSDMEQNMGARMLLASGWFAPSPIPVYLLTLAADWVQKEYCPVRIWRKFIQSMTCRCLASDDTPVGEASNLLVNIGMARSNAQQDSLHFHEIVKLYVRKRGGFGVARAVLRMIINGKSVPMQTEHIWAACFLIFQFGTSQATTKLNTVELVSFIKRLAVPLAYQTFTDFSRYKAALILLRLCTEALEDVRGSFVSSLERGQELSLCSLCSFLSSSNFNTEQYEELELLKTTLLELRAKLMMRGGEYGIAKELCEMAISIRSVLCGTMHPDTISLQEIKAKLVNIQTSIS